MENQERVVLQKSIEAKSRITLSAWIGMFLASAGLAYYLWERAPHSHVVLWPTLTMLALTARYLLARSKCQNLDEKSFDELRVLDNLLLACSFAAQAAVGSGIWLVAAYADINTQIFITGVIGFYSVGIMMNLSSDFRTFSLTIGVLLGQPIVFWLMEGTEGFPVIFPLGCLVLMGTIVVRQSASVFRESILIRFEKDALLAQVEAAKAETETALEMATKANKAKAFFMAAASHDLRQPLFAISIVNETILLKEPDTPHRDLLERQKQSIEAMNNLFGNLLDLAQFDSGKITPVISIFRLSTLMEPMLSEFMSLCDRKQLTFSCTISEATVQTDYDLTSRVIRNLVSNAIRYTERGQISIGFSESSSLVQINVTDTGPGIPEADQLNIFNEFVQLENAVADRNKGVGLGLAIVKNINELLGLHLSIQSAINQGTTFSISLPKVASI